MLNEIFLTLCRKFEIQVPKSQETGSEDLQQITHFYTWTTQLRAAEPLGRELAGRGRLQLRVRALGSKRKPKALS